MGGEKNHYSLSLKSLDLQLLNFYIKKYHFFFFICQNVTLFLLKKNKKKSFTPSGVKLFFLYFFDYDLSKKDLQMMD